MKERFQVEATERGYRVLDSSATVVAIVERRPQAFAYVRDHGGRVHLQTVHVRAAMSAQRNKTDKADALGIAHLMRTGWFRQAYIQSQDCYRTKFLLTHRRNLKAKVLDLENAIRHTLKSFGIRLSKVGRVAFEQAVRAAVADDPLSAELMDAMLTARRAVEAALPAARCRREDRRGQRSVPTLHGHPRRQPGDGSVVHVRERRPVALPPFA